MTHVTIEKSDPFDPLTHDQLTHCLLWWPEHMHNKSKMADGRHLGKIEESPYLRKETV